MNSRRPSRLSLILSTVLILGTALSPSAMALSAARGTMPAGHHHTGHQAPGPNSGNPCCDMCWTACATAPGVPEMAALPPAIQSSYDAARPASPGLFAALVVPHRLPFPQGPPTS